MLTARSIHRYFRQSRFQALLEALAANDAPICPDAVRRRLKRTAAGPTALGLRRLLELSRGPSAEANEMAKALLERQGPEGAVEHDLLVTAAATAAWGAMLNDGWRGHPGSGGKMEAAQRLALKWLATRQQDEGLFDPGLPSDETDAGQRHIPALTAWIFMLLGDDPAFRKTIKLHEFLIWSDAHTRSLDDETRALLRIARLRLNPTTPVHASLAA